MASSTRKEESGSNDAMALVGVCCAHLGRECGVVAQVWLSWCVVGLVIFCEKCNSQAREFVSVASASVVHQAAVELGGGHRSEVGLVCFVRLRKSEDCEQ
jgi:hypothetical protein